MRLTDLEEELIYWRKHAEKLQEKLDDLTKQFKLDENQFKSINESKTLEYPPIMESELVSKRKLIGSEYISKSFLVNDMWFLSKKPVELNIYSYDVSGRKEYSVSIVSDKPIECMTSTICSSIEDAKKSLKYELYEYMYKLYYEEYCNTELTIVFSDLFLTFYTQSFLGFIYTHFSICGIKHLIKTFNYFDLSPDKLNDGEFLKLITKWNDIDEVKNELELHMKCKKMYNGQWRVEIKKLNERKYISVGVKDSIKSIIKQAQAQLDIIAKYTEGETIADLARRTTFKK